jgi:predicted restriction endonuclease
VRRPLRRTTPLARTALAPVSPAQRAKVGGLRCLVCGAVTHVDPAHLVPRTLGGCDAADCVVPLCRTHHRAYDQGRLDLVAYLEPQWRAEVAHAVCHLGLMRTLRRLSGRRAVGDEEQ